MPFAAIWGPSSGNPEVPVPYSVDDLRKVRAQKADAGNVLASIPPDAPHDTDDALGFWNGERFVSWERWVLSRREHIASNDRE